MTGTTGMGEAEVRRPGDLSETRDAMAGRGSVLLRGGGTKLDWGGPAPATDVIIDTRGLDALIDYDPADATAAVQAGMPLAHLQQVLGEHGQWLAIDPPLLEAGATVGGVLATDDAGPRRLRYGTMRDLVIGTTVVLTDGAIGRSGGHVIKNVAGYDVAKLLVGSLGTLGLVAEVVVRVHPLPAASVTVCVPEIDPAAATALALAVMASSLEPAALDLVGDGLWVRFEGHADAVRSQADDLVGLARQHAPDAAGRADTLDGADERAQWDRLVAALPGGSDHTLVRVAALPSQLPEVVAAIDAATGPTGVAANRHSHTALGIHVVTLEGAPDEHAAVVAALRSEMAVVGGHVVVRRLANALAAVASADHPDGPEIWGREPSAAMLMARVRSHFDPAGRLAPGRSPGGI